MARTVSGPKLALLNGQRLNFHTTAKVEDGDGTMRDLSNIVGVDFYNGASLTWNIDQQVASGTINLRREGRTSAGVAVSIAPSMQTSPANKKVDTTYSPLLVAGRRLQWLAAWTAADVAPIAGDWMLVFDGKIDVVNWKGLEPTVTLEVRDRGAWLQQTMIEELRTYSDATGVPVETIMQQILDDNPNAKLGAVTLHVPVSPGWNIRKYQQDQVSVMDALVKLAQQIGWDVRYLWREATTQFELTFYEPDRAKVVSDWTLGPDQYVEVNDLKQSDANVRNRIRADTRDSVGASLTSLAVDAPSIGHFGPMYMKVVEEATTNIDTQAELDAFTAAMLSDLRDPIADQEIENYLFPVAELGDLGTWLANGRHYDTNQQYAVVQIRHDVSRETRRTFIQSRGSVAGAFNRWLRLAGSAGVGETGADVPPNPSFAFQVEGTAFDNARLGAMHITIFFEPNTAQVLIYGSEAPDGDEPPPAPALVESNLLATVVRHEGIASAPGWWTEVTSVTPSGHQRRVIALPIGPTGLRGVPFVAIAVCVDTGAGPTAPPKDLVVTMSTVDDVPRAGLVWDNDGDAASNIRVWRNGVIIIPRLAAGLTNVVDIGVAAGVVYTYQVQHIRNGQTSDFADADDAVSDAPTLAAPTWASGYPRGGGYDSFEDDPPPNGIAMIGVDNPDPLASTQLWMNDQDTIGGTYSLVTVLGPGVTGASLNASTTPHAVTDHPRWFYLVAVRTGYTNSPASTIQSANFGA